MSKTPPDTPDTLSLNTKVEEDFVQPLTAVRGALELLRDNPDLDAARRREFVERALQDCERLRRGVDELAASVYAPALQAMTAGADQSRSPGEHADRIQYLDEENIIEIDFSDLVFSDSGIVNEIFDGIESELTPAGKRWLFLVNYRNCRVWPEAWIAFAHRGRMLSDSHSLGSVRYDDSIDQSSGSILPSRATALSRLREMAKSD